MKNFMMFLASALMMNVATLQAANVESDDNSKVQVATLTVSQNEVDTVNFQIRIRLRDLTKAMHLENEQIECIQYANREFAREVANLAHVPSENRQDQLRRIVAENLAAVRKVSNASQYRAYLSVFNTEMNKAGLNNVLYGCMASK